MAYRVLTGDVRSFSRHYHGEKFSALLCDPPYELGFMGRNWDKSGVAFHPETWASFLPLLHDGAFIMAFASSRGWHRLACAIEDAGFVIHPSIFGWSFGSGFPKATRIDTQIDKAAGAEREIVGQESDGSGRRNRRNQEQGYRPNVYSSGDLNTFPVTAPATDLAKAWASHRYGLQALKPAVEPIIVAQKPYKGNPIDSITTTGAGALWIDGGRIGYVSDKDKDSAIPQGRITTRVGEFAGRVKGDGRDAELDRDTWAEQMKGRWPANFILLDKEAAEALDRQSGERPSGGVTHQPIRSGYSGFRSDRDNGTHIQREPDTGGASRFFFRVQEQIDEADPVYYCAKASRSERDAGLDGLEETIIEEADMLSGSTEFRYDARHPDGVTTVRKRAQRNTHPTVKPIKLTEYLAKLLLPPKEYEPRRIFVPFCGVASEMIGAGLAGWEEIIGVDSDAENKPIAQARLKYWLNKPVQGRMKV